MTSGDLRRFPVVALIVACAMVVRLIADLGRPQIGLVRVKQAAPIDARRDLHRDILSGPVRPPDSEAPQE